MCEHSNPAGSRFCNGCGSPLHLRLCPKCGAADEVLEIYCHECGAKLPEAGLRDAGLPEPATITSAFAAKETPVEHETQAVNEPHVVGSIGAAPPPESVEPAPRDKAVFAQAKSPTLIERLHGAAPRSFSDISTVQPKTVFAEEPKPAVITSPPTAEPILLDIDDLLPAGTQVAPVHAPMPRPARRRMRPAFIAVGAAALVMVAVLQWSRSRAPAADVQAGAPAQSPPPAAVGTITVAPVGALPVSDGKVTPGANEPTATTAATATLDLAPSPATAEPAAARAPGKARVTASAATPRADDRPARAAAPPRPPPPVSQPCTPPIAALGLCELPAQVETNEVTR